MKRIFSPVDSEIEAQNSGSGRDAAPSQIRAASKEIIAGQDGMQMQMQQAKKARMRSGGSADSSTCSLGSKNKKTKMSVISSGDDTGTGTEMEMEVEVEVELERGAGIEAEAQEQEQEQEREQEQTHLVQSPAVGQVPVEIVRKSTRPRRKPQEHLVSSATQHHAYAPSAPTAAARKHRHSSPGGIIPLDADDLSSEEEQEFQQFVARTFQLRESVEEADHYSSSGGAGSGSGSRIHVLKAQGISVYPSVHAPCPMAELPFWNLQHRKHIHVRLDESCVVSDITLMTGRMSASRNMKKLSLLSDPEKQTSWYEHYPFRFAQANDHGSGDTDATGHGNDHHGDGNGTGTGAASKRRSSKAHPMHEGGDAEVCKTAATSKLGASKDKNGVATASKDHAKQHHHHHKSSRTNRHEARRHRYDDIDVLHQQFVPHKTKKGWVVCNICNEEQWAPNMRKHQRTCPEHDH
eukprot:CAMPEP_0184706626 /NCGR_PEP_ID=MMETSP0313-20130426/36856_1 /TAXON_ID=2792 /ORGANISM="Porphyridium aerugineum, Strain SAG 1380-2" /LENGTH=463 /DNA_ID=CAMNT_0027168185 /DNA_START=463 /DNA_END=1854 /DNA_ORIENTATION=-